MIVDTLLLISKQILVYHFVKMRQVLLISWLISLASQLQSTCYFNLSLSWSGFRKLLLGIACFKDRPAWLSCLPRIYRVNVPCSGPIAGDEYEEEEDIFVAGPNNTKAPPPVRRFKVPHYAIGPLDLCTTFFYTLVWVVLHAVCKEYLWDVSLNPACYLVCTSNVNLVFDSNVCCHHWLIVCFSRPCHDLSASVSFGIEWWLLPPTSN